MSKSAIFTSNQSNQAFAANAVIPFGSVIRRYGPSVQLDGSSILLCGSGYYDCECSFSAIPAAAGNVTIQLFQDGVAVPGATATGTGVAGSPLNLSFPCLVRNCGCDCNSTLTLRCTAALTNLVNLAIVVEKQ